ncbi:MAG TPA: hypothetical protein V6D03_00005, partial [Candidatus Caenarcaniphilales bacterium]
QVKRSGLQFHDEPLYSLGNLVECKHDINNSDQTLKLSQRQRTHILVWDMFLRIIKSDPYPFSL